MILYRNSPKVQKDMINTQRRIAMAKSKARKTREKLVREGYRDPAKNRGIYALGDLRTRKSKTKHEKQYQNKYGELSPIDKSQVDDSSFLLSYIYISLVRFCRMSEGTHSNPSRLKRMIMRTENEGILVIHFIRAQSWLRCCNAHSFFRMAY